MARAALLLGILLLLAGCREQVDAGGSSTSTTSEVPTSTTTTRPPDTTAIPDPGTTSTTSTTTTTTTLPPLVGFELTQLASGLSRPTFVTAAPGTDDLFLLNQTGRVLRLAATAIEPEVVLDLTDRVGAYGIEQGLLGLAFHPEFDRNGRFFLYYTDLQQNSVLSEFSEDSGVMDPDSEQFLLQAEQPTDRHNAGMLAFGPDGLLYLALGDGGKASIHSQDPKTVLSSILRLDVDGATPYAIPEGNPFKGSEEGADEVWAYGLRNPWRFSIDPVDRLMYIGDVGQERFEEVDVISLDEPGHNLGWIPMEGTACFQRACVPEDFTGPVLDYPHSEGCSVTGGYVYRGKAIPEIDGTYFYADWCGSWVRSFTYVDGAVTEEKDWTNDLGKVGQVTSFGIDSRGELHILTSEGFLYRLDPVR